MNILFWNIQKKSSFFDTIVDVVNEEQIDILLLTEFPYVDSDGNQKDYISSICSKLQTEVDRSYEYFVSTKKRVEVFYRSNIVKLSEMKDMPLISVCKIENLGGGDKISMVFLHLESKVNYDTDEQSEAAEDARVEIEKYEREHQTDRKTIVCGDFNMNPFEKGMIKARGFHAVMDEKTAKKKSRKYKNKEYHYFYNPMWGFLGDLGRGEVSGTYYFAKSRHILYFWNLYDQVLVRPEALQYFDKSSLKIVTKKTGKYNLLSKSGLLSKEYSDHLPIKYTINL